MVDKPQKRAFKKGTIEMQLNLSKAEVEGAIWGKETNQTWQERWNREGEGKPFHQIQRSVKVTWGGSGNR